MSLEELDGEGSEQESMVELITTLNSEVLSDSDTIPFTGVPLIVDPSANIINPESIMYEDDDYSVPFVEDIYYNTSSSQQSKLNNPQNNSYTTCRIRPPVQPFSVAPSPIRHFTYNDNGKRNIQFRQQQTVDDEYSTFFDEGPISMGFAQGQKKLTFQDVEYKINKEYFDIHHKYSSALDILASYLKGHKVIYMETKSYAETWLNLYMLPSIALSTIATV